MELSFKNENYSAQIIRVKQLNQLENCDNVVGLPIFGYQAIVGKDTKEGSLMVLFTAETKLSNDFCYNNNLYRKSEMNKDKEKSGYLDDKGRVKAIKFRGHNSSALIMELSSLSYLGINIDELKEGDIFDTINGVMVCEKYIIKNNNEKKLSNKLKGTKKIFDRVDPKLFPEHIDTDNYYRNEHRIPDDKIIIATTKLHGTSGRLGHILVKRELSFFERILKRIGFKINDTEYDYIAGSRRTIKDLKSGREYNNFYDCDIWNQNLNRFKGLIPKNYILYGEIVGYQGTSEIQKNYTYDLDSGNFEFYIYRIVITNPDGFNVDLSWEQVKEFCKENGFKYCNEIFVGKHSDFKKILPKFIDTKHFDLWNADNNSMNEMPIECSRNSPCDEGICVRVEGLTPYLTKAKYPLFLNHETGQLDQGVIDIESSESVTE